MAMPTERKSEAAKQSLNSHEPKGDCLGDGITHRGYFQGLEDLLGYATTAISTLPSFRSTCMPTSVG
ncbi:hypothetical protein TBK1r_41480 [Stieleria magnilauensis]|uniref:Uncharacterized protein n=1 Tax=Stieleria magnilauensis TaxID=2527963 RepID=A0ABX5XZF8_9BACT|nr:hypothetical protein TBK1r_41480 [Planctomycetes bacterium TBK1r]